MPLDPETLNLVRAEAAAVAKVLCRAEAKAQSTLRAKDLADQANKLFAEHGKASDIHGAAINRLAVMVDVMLDLLVDDKPMRAEGRPEDKRAKFHALCAAKAKTYGFHEVPG